jgi:hypothetical protein
MESVGSKKVTPKSRKTARKAVGFVEALISTLRDPDVQRGAQEVIDHQKRRAAELSLAGQANQVLGVATNPQVLAIADLFVAVAKRHIVTRKR